MEKIINNIKLQCLQGNIANQKDITAIVNAANAQLVSGLGVAGAIHSAAGPELEIECRKYAPIKPGMAVITGAYNLPNKYVVHTLGPIYGVDKPEEVILAQCYRHSLLLADEYKIDSIAFPAISTGIFGYPLEEASKVALKTVIEILPSLKNIKLIRFVLYSDKDFEIFKRIFEDITMNL